MTTAVEVIEANPVNVVALLPRATPVLPMVNELFARLLLAIEDAVVRTVPVSAASFLRSAVCPAPFADVTENTFALISCVATIKFCSEKIF